MLAVAHPNCLGAPPEGRVFGLGLESSLKITHIALSLLYSPSLRRVIPDFGDIVLGARCEQPDHLCGFTLLCHDKTDITPAPNDALDPTLSDLDRPITVEIQQQVVPGSESIRPSPRPANPM